MEDCIQGKALPMVGGAYARGIAQADYVDRDKVRKVINLRLVQNVAVFENPVVREYLSRQWEFSQKHCSEELSEMTGVADGFGIDTKRLFDFLHMGIAQNLDARVVGHDGCSTWAVSNLPEGPAVGKNRDFTGENPGLQAVFEHRDPDWPDGRKVLCVGSFGAPSVYSSGVNSDGLVVVDTHVSTSDCGVGWLRYFLMTRLLTDHKDVASALEFIKMTTHAGGGSLTLADPSGRIAAVDLGHTGVSILERKTGWVARTNHFEAGSVPNFDDDVLMQDSTFGRYSTLVSALSRPDKSLDSLRTLMGSHTTEVMEGLCRHGEDGDSRTLSSAIFLCKTRKLYFTDGTPCDSGWKEYSL
ncbi:MAG: C45 family autoproteolytic acyltransferase/hydrolase [Paracoccaceae bacterium]